MTEQFVTDKLHEFYQISLRYLRVLYEEQTPYQHIQVVESEFFGKVLLLDGIVQLTELDNPAYHEMITHVPMLAHDEPRKILIVGGGDGGVLQQVLRYDSVEDVEVVELDARVIEICREHFPSFGDPYQNARVHLHIKDAFDYLKNTDQKFDVIIADTTDPVGEAGKLFTEEFYAMMAEHLYSDGVIVTQCEHMYFDGNLIKNMLDIGRKLCQHAAYYYTLVPTYPGGSIGFMYISDVPWWNGLRKKYPGTMQYLNRDIHEAAFVLPQFLATLLK